MLFVCNCEDAADSLAKNIVRLRSRLGWSQERLAAEAALHRTYVGAVERKERNPSLKSICRIAAALGVTVADLLSLPDERELHPRPAKA